VLGLARDGSGQALGELLEGCRQYLLLIANQQLEPELRVKSAASDLVQETFVSAGRHFQAFRGTTEEEFRAWLRRILLHHLVSQRRRFLVTQRRNARRDVSLQSVCSSAIQPKLTLAAETSSPSAHAILGEELQLIERTLQNLGDRQRYVIELRHRDQLSFGEIAQRLDISTSAARQLWARAVKRLKQQIASSHVQLPRRVDRE
jgi:RNA polymerase sigma-70 factor (ECF subfamily)